MTKEERTSKRVAAIAGRVMKKVKELKTGVGALPLDYLYLVPKYPKTNMRVCTLAELEALAASCLTQAPDKTHRNPRVKP